mmetsp:Transcript_11491/g.26143  ORF Transcript_11491/g.26143 Transcript_11491/m.26143 type:complete len:198 (-) Transcript_11491:18-611(-)
MAPDAGTARELADRLRGVGIEAPDEASGEAEAWRRCLAELCSAYLGKSAATAPSEPLSKKARTSAVPAAPEPLPGDLQLGVLRVRAESYRRRSFELRCELEGVMHRQALIEQQAAEDPIIGLRSLGDFVACLRKVHAGCAEALEEEELLAASDEPPRDLSAPPPADVGDLVDSLKAACDRLAPVPTAPSTTAHEVRR